MLKVIGKGSEGTVYLGRIRATKQQVAIKQINTDLEVFYSAKQVRREIPILGHLPGSMAGDFMSRILDVVWEPFLARAATGSVLFARTLARFRKTIGQMA